MLRVLFPRFFHRYESSRSGAELAAFARWLHATGYFHAVMRRHVYRLRRVFEASVALQCGQTLNEAELRKAFALVPCSQRHASTERVYRRFLKVEGRLEESTPTDQVGLLRLRYRQYLQDVRGSAPATIAQHLETIDAFLASSLGSTGHLSTLTSEHVEISSRPRPVRFGANVAA